MAELTTGAISAATALFLANQVRIQLKRHYQLIDNPLLDVAGIFIGTLFVIVIYYFTKRKKPAVYNKVGEV